MTPETSARRMLAELIESCETIEHYLDAIWAQRVQTTSAASTGWPFKPSAGVIEQSKLRKVK